MKKVTSGSICAFFDCQVNWNANSSAQEAYRPTRRVHSRPARSCTHHSVPSAARKDGSRNAMRQLAVTVKNAACSHISIGGLSEYSSVPRCGNSQLPLRSEERRVGKQSTSEK